MDFQSIALPTELRHLKRALVGSRSLSISWFSKIFHFKKRFSFKALANLYPFEQHTRVSCLFFTLLFQSYMPTAKTPVEPTFQSLCPFKLGYIDIRASESRLLSVGYSSTEIPLSYPSNALTERATTQLQDYFKGKRTDFDLPLSLDRYSPFYQSVWEALLTIPYGKTSNYSQIAKKLDNPKAVRAVGMANGRNPFCIVVPCHRIIGKDNSLTGYAHGLEMKRWLLELEGAMGEQKTLF